MHATTRNGVGYELEQVQLGPGAVDVIGTNRIGINGINNRLAAIFSLAAPQSQARPRRVRSVLHIGHGTALDAKRINIAPNLRAVVISSFRCGCHQSGFESRQFTGAPQNGTNCRLVYRLWSP